MVYDYDLFYISGTSSSSSTSIPLYLNGSSTNGPVTTPDDYYQKVNRMVISNSASTTQYVSLTAIPNSQVLPSGTPSIPIATISVPSTGTLILSDEDIQSSVPPGYYLSASVPSAVSGITVSASAYFVKG